MAKKTFNFSQTPAAREINGAMEEANRTSTAPVPSFRRRVRTDKDWTLTQCRLPNDLHARMSDFCHDERISINEFLIVAVRQLLDTTRRP